MTHRTIHPEGWLPAKGYATGMLAKDGVLHIGGQVGWKANKECVNKSSVVRTQQALQSVADIARETGGEVTDINRLTWLVIDKTDGLAYQGEVGAACRAVFGRQFPAMSVAVVAGLVECAVKVEKEATAHLSRDCPHPASASFHARRSAAKAGRWRPPAQMILLRSRPRPSSSAHFFRALPLIGCRSAWQTPPLRTIELAGAS